MVHIKLFSTELKGFKRKLVVGTAISAGIVFVLILISLWLRADITKKIEAMQKINKELAFRLKATEVLASLKKDLEEAERQRLALNVMLPIQDKLIDFPKDINNLANRHDISASLAFGSQVEGTETTPGYLGFVLTASGNFDDWLKFVQALEESRYLISFDSFNMVGDGNNFQTVINGKVFSQ